MTRGMERSGTVRSVGKPNQADAEINERIRAHIRERMERRGLGVTAAAKSLHCSQGQLSRFLLGQRGATAGFAKRVCDAFHIDPDALFNVDPPASFFRQYVPRPEGPQDDH